MINIPANAETRRLLRGFLTDLQDYIESLKIDYNFDAENVVAELDAEIEYKIDEIDSFVKCIQKRQEKRRSDAGKKRIRKAA